MTVNKYTLTRPSETAGGDGSKLKTLGALVAVGVISSLATASLFGVAPAGAFSVPNNSVTSAKIVNETIQGLDIKDGTVTPFDLSATARPRWAKVDAGTNTSLIRGRGAVSASRIGQGIYEVVFASPINNCGWSATLNNNDWDIPGVGFLSVHRYQDNKLWVRTFDAAADSADLENDDGFTLMVQC